MVFAPKTSFTSGEISPGLTARTDLDQYAKAVKKLENFYIHTTGGVSNRPGTLFVADTGETMSYGDTSPRCRLVPFQFSTDDGYVLEFTDGRIRFIQDDALVTSSGSPVEVSTSYTAAQLFELDFAQSGDVLYIVHRSHAPRKLSRLNSGGTLWEFAPVDFVDGPYADRKAGDEDTTITADGRTGTVTLTSTVGLFNADMVGLPFRVGFEDTSDPTDIQWGWGTIATVVSASEATLDVEEPLGYELMFNPDFENALNGWMDESSGAYVSGEEMDAVYNESLKTVTLTSGTDAEDDFGRIAQEVDYFPQKTKVHLRVEAVIATGGRLQVQAGHQLSDDKYYKHTFWPGDEDADNYFHAYFTTPTDDKILMVTLDNRKATTGTTTTIYGVSMIRDEMSTSQWRQCAFKAAQGGYPSKIVFHDQRLVYASSDVYPQTLWMSRPGNFYDFSFTSPGRDDDAINLSLASRKIDAIRWMVSTRVLLLGTNSSIWSLAPGSQSDALTPTSLNAQLQSAGGCADMPPIAINDRVLYVERGGKSIKELGYRFESDAFAGRDLTLLAKHFFEHRGITSWDYAELNDSLLYCVMDDGSCLVAAYLPEQEVLGWSRYTLSGHSGYMDVCVLNDIDGDLVYFICNRFNSDFIEKQMPRITYYSGVRVCEHEEIEFVTDEGGPGGDYHFLDCCVARVGASSLSTIYAAHLAGEDVNVLADGHVYEDITVADNGAITLPVPAQAIVAGIKYTCRLDTLDLDALPDKKAISALWIRVRESREFFVRNRYFFQYLGGEQSYPYAGDTYFSYPDNDDEGWSDEVVIESPWEYKLRSELIDEDGPLKLRSGTIRMTLTGNWKHSVAVSIIQDRPLPLTILAVIPEVIADER